MGDAYLRPARAPRPGVAVLDCCGLTVLDCSGLTALDCCGLTALVRKFLPAL